MYRNQVVLGLMPSIKRERHDDVAVALARSREGKRALIRVDQALAPAGSSTLLALATKTSDRSRTYCISGWPMSQSRMTGCKISLGFS